MMQPIQLPTTTAGQDQPPTQPAQFTVVTLPGPFSTSQPVSAPGTGAGLPAPTITTTTSGGLFNNGAPATVLTPPAQATQQQQVQQQQVQQQQVQQQQVQMQQVQQQVQQIQQGQQLQAQQQPTQQTGQQVISGATVFGSAPMILQIPVTLPVAAPSATGPLTQIAQPSQAAQPQATNLPVALPSTTGPGPLSQIAQPSQVAQLALPQQPNQPVVFTTAVPPTAPSGTGNGLAAAPGVAGGVAGVVPPPQTALSTFDSQVLLNTLLQLSAANSNNNPLGAAGATGSAVQNRDGASPPSPPQTPVPLLSSCVPSISDVVSPGSGSTDSALPVGSQPQSMLSLGQAPPPPTTGAGGKHQPAFPNAAPAGATVPAPPRASVAGGGTATHLNPTAAAFTHHGTGPAVQQLKPRLGATPSGPAPGPTLEAFRAACAASRMANSSARGAAPQATLAAETTTTTTGDQGGCHVGTPHAQAPPSPQRQGHATIPCADPTLQQGAPPAARVAPVGGPAARRSYTKLFVGQLPPRPNLEQWIAEVFEPYGVHDIKVHHKNRACTAFVWCESRTMAEAALRDLDGLKYQNGVGWFSLSVEAAHSSTWA